VVVASIVAYVVIIGLGIPLVKTIGSYLLLARHPAFGIISASLFALAHSPISILLAIIAAVITSLVNERFAVLDEESLRRGLSPMKACLEGLCSGIVATVFTMWMIILPILIIGIILVSCLFIYGGIVLPQMEMTAAVMVNFLIGFAIVFVVFAAMASLASSSISGAIAGFVGTWLLSMVSADVKMALDKEGFRGTIKKIDEMFDSGNKERAMRWYLELAKEAKRRREEKIANECLSKASKINKELTLKVFDVIRAFEKNLNAKRWRVLKSSRLGAGFVEDLESRKTYYIYGWDQAAQPVSKKKVEERIKKASFKGKHVNFKILLAQSFSRSAIKLVEKVKDVALIELSFFKGCDVYGSLSNDPLVSRLLRFLESET
jgi:hypothetical protein